MNKGCLHIVRGDVEVLVLPAPSIVVKSNGTLWCGASPILGISDPIEKTRCASLQKAGKTNQVPEQYFTHLGDNANGLWAGWDADYATHPVKLAADERNQKAAEVKAALAKVTATIILSSRGWGDFESVKWTGDVTRPNADIIVECRKLLSNANDVDHNPTDAEIIADLDASRTKLNAPKVIKEKFKYGTGYCYSCESYCYGDCGNYQPVKTEAMQIAELQKNNIEASYGIND